MNARHAFDSLRAYSRVMQGPMDLYTYARLRMAYAARGAASEPRSLRVRALGGLSLLVRPSQDVWTFRDTFLARYHLPPVPVPEGGVIVDLGSNVGYTLADFAHTYPHVRVVGVEMDERNWLLARRNTAHFGGRVQVLHAAVWTHDGDVTYEGDGDDAFRVRPEKGGLGRHAPARRLATIFAECGITRVDYLKMDIEGAEAMVLERAPEWASRVRSMKVELHRPATYDRAEAALAPLGFHCRRDEHHPDCLVAVREGALA